jgi:hypothetical protein
MISAGRGALESGKLGLHIDGTLSGCSQSFPATYEFSGTWGGPGPFLPQAVLAMQPNKSVPVGTRITVDGTLSTNSRAGPLTYRWELSRPAASANGWTDGETAKPTTAFYADVAGPYVMTLRVSNGAQESAPARSAILVGTSGVLAVTQQSLTATPGDDVFLDASASTDSLGRPLSFEWTLTSRPDGSTAAISDARAAIAHLHTDLPGAYTASIKVSAGDSSSILPVEILAGLPLPRLAFEPVDAKYSRALDRVIAVSRIPNVLHILDPFRVGQPGADVSVPLSSSPRCVALLFNGLSALVGDDAGVTLVDIVQGQERVVVSWPASIVPGDVVLGPPVTISGRNVSIAYVFAPATGGGRSPIYTIDLETGAETQSAGLIDDGTHPAQVPGDSYMYAAQSSGVLYGIVTQFDSKGSPQVSFALNTPSPVPLGTRAWFSADGPQILTAGGVRYRYFGPDNGRVELTSGTLLRSADWSAAANAWIVQPESSTNPDDQAYWILDGGSLAKKRTNPFPPLVDQSRGYRVHGRYVFFDSSGQREIALGQIDASSKLALDFVVMVK